jgi:hypothetical protein
VAEYQEYHTYWSDGSVKTKHFQRQRKEINAGASRSDTRKRCDAGRMCTAREQINLNNSKTACSLKVQGVAGRVNHEGQSLLLMVV